MNVADGTDSGKLKSYLLSIVSTIIACVMGGIGLKEVSCNHFNEFVSFLFMLLAILAMGIDIFICLGQCEQSKEFFGQSSLKIGTLFKFIALVLFAIAIGLFEYNVPFSSFSMLIYMAFVITVFGSIAVAHELCECGSLDVDGQASTNGYTAASLDGKINGFNDGNGPIKPSNNENEDSEDEDSDLKESRNESNIH